MTDETTRARQRMLMDLYHNSPIGRDTKMTLSYNDEGAACFHFPYDPKFDHAMGATHGGPIATLIDNAGWFTAATRYDTWISTVDLNVKLLEVSRKSDLFGKGRLIRTGKSLAVVEMEVRDERDRLIAIGSGTFTVTKVPYQG
jgi:uncharacterized protein (TIGR00369 family)